MNILIIGSGGREHALGLRLSQDQNLNTEPHTLYFAPGNPGCESLGQRLSIDIHDHQGLALFAKKEHIDLTIVGPEQPLADGIVDYFQKQDLLIFGPTQAGARIEASKHYAKELMAKANIPTAQYTHYPNPLDVPLSNHPLPMVIKEDGLAAGKGVTIAHTKEAAQQALENASKKGVSVVLESFLTGEELSILAICDGGRAIPLVSAQDFKKARDNNQGPNTGGMGAYAPVPFVNPALLNNIQNQVLNPMMSQLKAEGIDYRGVLYAGLMVNSANDINVIEFNARFGDPETQVVLPLIQEDFAPILQAAAKGDLSTWEDQGFQIKEQSAVTVVLTAEGYPSTYPKGDTINFPETSPSHTHIIHAGTKKQPDQTIVTNGGRVLNAVGQGNTLNAAREKAYELVQHIQFKGKTFRTDIAQQAAQTTATTATKPETSTV